MVTRQIIYISVALSNLARLKITHNQPRNTENAGDQIKRIEKEDHARSPWLWSVSSTNSVTHTKRICCCCCFLSKFKIYNHVLHWNRSSYIVRTIAHRVHAMPNGFNVQSHMRSTLPLILFQFKSHICQCKNISSFFLLICCLISLLLLFIFIISSDAATVVVAVAATTAAA